MNDVDGPFVVEAVHRALYEGDLDSECIDPEVIHYALDAAVSKLHGRGYHPSRWAPYVHIGM